LCDKNILVILSDEINYYLRKNSIFMKKINLVGPLKLNYHQINYELETYFVDGGVKYKKYFKHNKTSFGDGDSVEGESATIDVKLDIDKDFSDYQYALSQLIDHHTIHLQGLYGDRFDHQLAIIGDTFRLLENNPDKLIYLHTQDKYPWIFSSYKSYSYPIRDDFSLFTLNEQEIELKGAKFPLNQRPFKLSPLSSLAISNKSTKNSVHIKNQRPLLIIPIIQSI
jgi:thiamine pyrophosphokinase